MNFFFKFERISSIQRPQLAKVCEVLSMRVLDDNDYEFLAEYQNIMRSIAVCLKKLEADEYTFGIYLPALFGLRFKLASLKNRAVHCKALVDVLSENFEERFGYIMDIFQANGKSLPAYIAMVSNPNYKLNYIGMKSIPSHIVLRVKQMLFTAVTDILGEKDILDDETVDVDEENGTSHNIHNRA